MAAKPHDALAAREARPQLPAMLELSGGRGRVAGAFEHQAGEAGRALDSDEAIAIADEELREMRRERGRKRR